MMVKKKYSPRYEIILLTVIFILTVIVSLAYASQIEISQIPTPTAKDVIVTILIGIASFLAIRALRKIDANQTQLFNQLGALSKEFYELKGAHDMAVGTHKKGVK